MRSIGTNLAVLGSGEAGKYLAWTLSKTGHRTAVVERSMVAGSCPNVACLPSKNIIHGAKVASLARRGREFGLEIGSMSTNMAGVQGRSHRRQRDLATFVNAELFARSNDATHSVISRITRHGLPAANARSGMSRVTTLPAPITAHDPIRTPGR